MITGANLAYLLLMILGGIALGYFLYFLYCAGCWLVRSLRTARLLAQEWVAYRQTRRQLRSLARRLYLELAEAERADRRRRDR